MINLKLEDLLGYFQKNKIDAHLQQQTNQLYILYKIGEQEFPVFIRIFEGGELLQLLAFIPCNIVPGALNDTARLLHLLNKELDVPGFGMDENAMVLFYRCMIPAQNQKVDEALLQAYLNSIQVICKTFAAVVVAVATGAATYDEVLKKAQQTEKKAVKSKPSPKKH